MTKGKIFLAILLFECFSKAFGGDIIPVLIRVSRADQHDTLGSNFVDNVTALVYKEILSGDVKLWDAP
ncbi:MAG: hypothetical protein ABIT08_14220, partial [Bacteroidia bacterium]